MEKLEVIEEIVKQSLSEKRFNHSKCVQKRCEELAKIYNVDLDKARKVGIAHDIAKEMTDEEKMNYIKEHRLQIDDIEKENTALLHAKIGADIVKRKFEFTDDMIEAVAYHTTAKANMCMLSKILFVADATGEDRNWNDLEPVRKMSETDLDGAIIYIIELNIRQNMEKKKLIHPDSILALNELFKK